MRTFFVAVPALLFAGAALAQGEGRRNPLDHRVKVPPLEFRSAFEGYRAHAEPGLRDWRKSNDEVGAAGGHAGHRPGRGSGTETSKPQPGDPARRGHGGHK
jgi:hypothetical protein